MAMAYQTIRYERRADIGTLTLARPAKRNAQNPQMWSELVHVGTQLSGDDTLRCLVVMGEGSTFSAGLDLVEGLAKIRDELARLADPAAKLAAGMDLVKTFSWLPELGCPSVAAVQGHAYGAGLQLALACDFRIFAEGTKVGLTETRYGILPDMGATVRLPRIVGESRARELILLGEVIDAEEALRIGLANRVVAGEALEQAATEFAERLAAQPPLAVRGARKAIEVAWHRDPEESLLVALEAQLRCIESDDFGEAQRALVEGRSPRWRGK